MEFLKAVEILQSCEVASNDDEVSMDEKILCCRTISDYFTSKQYLGSGSVDRQIKKCLVLLLWLVNEEEMMLWSVVDECVNAILLHFVSENSHCDAVLLCLFKLVKSSQRPKTKREAIKKFGAVCWKLLPNQCRGYAAGLAGVINTIIVEMDNGVLSCLAEHMDEIMGVLVCYMKQAEVRSIIANCVKCGLAHKATAVKRSCISILCCLCRQYSNQQYQYVLSVLQTELEKSVSSDSHDSLKQGCLMCMVQLVNLGKDTRARHFDKRDIMPQCLPWLYESSFDVVAEAVEKEGSVVHGLLQSALEGVVSVLSVRGGEHFVTSLPRLAKVLLALLDLGKNLKTSSQSVALAALASLLEKSPESFEDPDVKRLEALVEMLDGTARDPAVMSKSMLLVQSLVVTKQKHDLLDVLTKSLLHESYVVAKSAASALGRCVARLMHRGSAPTRCVLRGVEALLNSKCNNFWIVTRERLRGIALLNFGLLFAISESLHLQHAVVALGLGELAHDDARVREAATQLLVSCAKTMVSDVSHVEEGPARVLADLMIHRVRRAAIDEHLVRNVYHVFSLLLKRCNDFHLSDKNFKSTVHCMRVLGETYALPHRYLCHEYFASRASLIARPDSFPNPLSSLFSHVVPLLVSRLTSVERLCCDLDFHSDVLELAMALIRKVGPISSQLWLPLFSHLCTLLNIFCALSKNEPCPDLKVVPKSAQMLSPVYSPLKSYSGYGGASSLSSLKLGEFQTSPLYLSLFGRLEASKSENPLASMEFVCTSGNDIPSLSTGRLGSEAKLSSYQRLLRSTMECVAVSVRAIGHPVAIFAKELMDYVSALTGVYPEGSVRCSEQLFVYLTRRSKNSAMVVPSASSNRANDDTRANVSGVGQNPLRDETLFTASARDKKSDADALCVKKSLFYIDCALVENAYSDTFPAEMDISQAQVEEVISQREALVKKFDELIPVFLKKYVSSHSVTLLRSVLRFLCVVVRFRPDFCSNKKRFVEHVISQITGKKSYLRSPPTLLPAIYDFLYSVFGDKCGFVTSQVLMEVTAPVFSAPYWKMNAQLVPGLSTVIRGLFALLSKKSPSKTTVVKAKDVRELSSHFLSCVLAKFPLGPAVTELDAILLVCKSNKEVWHATSHAILKTVLPAVSKCDAPLAHSVSTFCGLLSLADHLCLESVTAAELADLIVHVLKQCVGREEQKGTALPCSNISERHVLDPIHLLQVAEIAWLPHVLFLFRIWFEKKVQDKRDNKKIGSLFECASEDYSELMALFGEVIALAAATLRSNCDNAYCQSLVSVLYVHLASILFNADSSLSTGVLASVDLGELARNLWNISSIAALAKVLGSSQQSLLVETLSIAGCGWVYSTKVQLCVLATDKSLQNMLKRGEKVQGLHIMLEKESPAARDLLAALMKQMEVHVFVKNLDPADAKVLVGTARDCSRTSFQRLSALLSGRRDVETDLSALGERWACPAVEVKDFDTIDALVAADSSAMLKPSVARCIEILGEEHLNKMLSKATPSSVLVSLVELPSVRTKALELARSRTDCAALLAASKCGDFSGLEALWESDFREQLPTKVEILVAARKAAAVDAGVILEWFLGSEFANASELIHYLVAHGLWSDAIGLVLWDCGALAGFQLLRSDVGWMERLMSFPHSHLLVRDLLAVWNMLLVSPKDCCAVFDVVKSIPIVFFESEQDDPTFPESEMSERLSVYCVKMMTECCVGLAQAAIASRKRVEFDMTGMPREGLEGFMASPEGAKMTTVLHVVRQVQGWDEQRDSLGNRWVLAPKSNLADLDIPLLGERVAVLCEKLCALLSECYGDLKIRCELLDCCFAVLDLLVATKEEGLLEKLRNAVEKCRPEPSARVLWCQWIVLRCKLQAWGTAPSDPEGRKRAGEFLSMVEGLLSSTNKSVVAAACQGLFWMFSASPPASKELPSVLEKLRARLEDFRTTLTDARECVAVLQLCYWLVEVKTQECEKSRFTTVVVETCIAIAKQPSAHGAVLSQLFRWWQRLVVQFYLSQKERDRICTHAVEALRSSANTSSFPHAVALVLAVIYTGDYSADDNSSFMENFERVKDFFVCLRGTDLAHASVCAAVLPLVLKDFFHLQQTMSLLMTELVKSVSEERGVTLTCKVILDVFAYHKTDDLVQWVLICLENMLTAFDKDASKQRAIVAFTLLAATRAHNKLNDVFAHYLAEELLTTAHAKGLVEYALQFLTTNGLASSDEKVFSTLRKIE